jgi:hypothetical protein
MNIYVAYGRTESGDDLPLLAWHGKPTDADVEAAYRRILPAEFEDEAPGFVNSWVAKVEFA